MLRAGLVDKVSVLVATIADGRIGSLALFDVGDESGDAPPYRLRSLP